MTKPTKVMHRLKYLTIAQAMLAAMLTAAPVGQAFAQSQAEQEERVRQLEQELATTREELAEANKEIAAADDTGSSKIEFSSDKFGTLNIGGAVRVNYAIGDYEPTGGPSRAWDDGGNFSLDTFRFNADYVNGPYLGKFEYRFYDGYHFLHTGWLGYNFEDESQLQVGVNRVPFGPGPYGISQSWFFDQHYYVGLSDDMDLGIKYTMPYGDWKFDLAYYFSSEGNYAGHSNDSARYSYDVVNESGDGYVERNQFNVRGIYTVSDVAISTALGFSAEYGQLLSEGPEDDGDHYAVSVHMINKWNDFTLATQATYYDFDVDSNQPLGTDELVQFGAYDFPNTVAANAWIPAISLSYNKTTSGIAWLDYVIPYIEYSNIVKEDKSFNNSQLLIVGAAWASGGWYIYTDFAYSNGNEFVGGETPFGDRLGANIDDKWESRFNINFGYYF